jgi:CHASE3 domain sensor protein
VKILKRKRKEEEAAQLIRNLNSKGMLMSQVSSCFKFQP